VAGVEGNGQAELVDILMGLRKATQGKFFIDGDECTGASPGEIRRRGVACIPADRMGRGVATKASVEENLVADCYYRFSHWWGLDKRGVREFAKDLIHTFGIRSVGTSAPVASLSGGNIQRVVVAREFSTKPKLLIADQPTRGLDVAATEFVRNRLIYERDKSTAILLVSTDLEEILQLADRVIVMYNGTIAAHFDGVELITPERLGQYMLGVERQSEEEIEGALNC
jgi:simple sugar transport system ATP-binding protein